MKPAIEAKLKALMELKSKPNMITSAHYRKSRSLAQRTFRQALILYYVGIIEDIEAAAKNWQPEKYVCRHKNSYMLHNKEISASQIER